MAETRKRIANAAARCGRLCDSVGLVAISKGHPASALRALAGLGQRDFGENYAQELATKAQELALADARFHMIGHVQSNKVKKAAAVGTNAVRFDRQGSDGGAVAEQFDASDGTVQTEEVVAGKSGDRDHADTVSPRTGNLSA